jgi:hypothetical protein
MAKRHINPKIEQELLEFKVEIEEKFAKSRMNKEYLFPRPLLEREAPDIDTDFVMDTKHARRNMDYLDDLINGEESEDLEVVLTKKSSRSNHRRVQTLRHAQKNQTQRSHKFDAFKQGKPPITSLSNDSRALTSLVKE